MRGVYVCVCACMHVCVCTCARTHTQKWVYCLKPALQSQKDSSRPHTLGPVWHSMEILIVAQGSKCKARQSRRDTCQAWQGDVPIGSLAFFRKVKKWKHVSPG